MTLIYLDHNATSPPRPQALEAMGEAQSECFGNPSSQHAAGRKARALLEDCRDRLARLLEVRATEVVFTSGGTEANRLAIEGAFEGLPVVQPAHSVVSAMEHPSVLDVHAHLEDRGRVTVSRVLATTDGRVDLSALAAALQLNTRLVSLQHANSETGAVQPIGEVSVLLGSRSRANRGLTPALLHLDCVQSLGKRAVRPMQLGADLLTISSHKIGGPKGAGALIVRAGSGWLPPTRGGPQERKMRPGTENLPAIAGFVRAAELAIKDPERSPPGHECGGELGAVLRSLLGAAIDGVAWNGGPGDLLPNTVNVSFDGVAAELLVIRLDQEGVAVSMGSACASGSREPSHVLRAMGLSEARVVGAVRFSTGWTTRREEVERAAKIVALVVADLRSRSAHVGISGSLVPRP